MDLLKYSFIFLAISFILASPDSGYAGSSLKKLSKDLVKLEDGKLIKAKDLDLSSKKYVAFYYSANWCPPCKGFTPKLVEFYETMTKKYGDQFEMVFVSSDYSEEAMKEYMEWGKMSWPAVDFKDREDGFLRDHSARGIPYLVVLDQSGKEVLGKPEGEDWVYPGKLLPDFEKLLKEG
ncbi:MAG: thioredoxin-like domain-containing protein [Verrucomicrobiota bacterium]